MHTGIDLGFGCTALVTINDDLSLVRETYFGSQISKVYKDLVHEHPATRLLTYQKALRSHFVTKPQVLGTVVIEEPMGRLMGKSREIIALKGVYLVSVISSKIRKNQIFLPKPTQIKRIFTGNGKAGKEDIIKRCVELGYNPPNDHAADAFAMAYMSVIGDVDGLV